MSPAQSEDPRVRFAAERTLLAWIRTGLALMGFGFVVARFGLFLRQIGATVPDPTPPGGWSLKFGVALVLSGILINVRCYAVALEIKRIVGKSRYARTASRMRFRFAAYQLTPTRKQCDSSRRNARNANPT